MTEDFTYESAIGPGLTKKTTTLTNSPHAALPAMTENWTYGSLGLVATHGLPFAGATPNVTAMFGYSSGFPATLAAGQTLVSSANYNPSGGLSSWTAGNGIVTTIEQDTSLLPRPRRIFASAAGFDTGTYTYDGAGNITVIGSDAFTYDTRSRIKSGLGQTFSYDRWGNLNPTDVDRATNRVKSSAHDARGNVLRAANKVHRYDELSRQITLDSGKERYLYDAAGELVTGATGALLETHKYRPFGEEISGTFGLQPLKIAGMERDSSSGNDYNHARYQSFTLGRFLSPDLLGGTPEAPQSWNRYTYALNNPLKYVDPDGRHPVLMRAVEFAQRALNSPLGQRVQTYLSAQGTRLWNAATRFFSSPAGQEATQTAVELGTGSQLGPSMSGAAFIDGLVASSAKPASRQITEGARAIAKKLGHAESGGYESAFKGIAPTQENAEVLIRAILGDQAKVVVTRGYVDIFNKSGQGIRIEKGTNRFITFLEGILIKSEIR